MKYLLAVLVCAGSVFAQSSIHGMVSADATGDPMHGARVVLSPLGRSADADDNGRYEFRNVLPGTYDLVAESPGMAGTRVSISMGTADVTADLRLRVAAVRESLTVTASGREESVINALQSVAVLDLTQLPLRSSTSLGEVLQDEVGITKRSSGPGSGRPVIRGFDGDRVLVMQDGMGTGTLGSQSSDHGEPIDVNQLERIEVVRGPATLLYGSNAIGGAVNAISRHDVHQHASPGVRGFVNGTGGSNNGLAGGAAGFEIGAGNWQMWASGGGQRTGNYRAASHEVLNSQSRMQQTQAGVGYYGDRAFANFNYGFTDSRYGVPYDLNEVNAEIPELALRRHNYRGTFGLRNVGFLDSVTAKINHSDYKHQELIEGQVETEFFNKLTAYRVQFDQKKKGRWSGSFGFQGAHRNYNVVGAEALVPPVTQNTAAVFGVQNFDFESGLRVQLGGRVEHNAYDPIGLVKRSFTGFSGSAGVSQRLWTGGALALNYSHAYRAPALEELYNHGPHPGNALFEVGDPNLKREQNNGIDASLRHQSSRLRAEFNVFFYHLRDFVFFSPTGEVEDGLPVANYAQGTSKYRGLEGKFDVALHNSLWLNLGVDAVNARLTAEDMPLPRIPPVRGRVGVEFRHAGFSLKPEVQLAQAQTGVFFDETPTAGYAVANVQASYTHADAHRLQVFSVNVFNAGDTLYRNHLSLLKSFAPEIGRGVRFSYSLQVF